MSVMKSAVSVAGLIAAVGWLWPLPASAACGCSSLTLVHAGKTGVMCSDADLDFDKTECTKSAGGTEGCGTTYAYDCNVGVNSTHYTEVMPYQRTGFLSVATLTDGSTVGDCKTGELLQETIMGNGKLQPNPDINMTSVAGTETVGGKVLYIDNTAGHPFPQVGATQPRAGNPLFGGDDYADYTASEVLFSYNTRTRQLSWWDNTDQTKDNQAEAASWSYKYISFVKGSTSRRSCACAFDIQVTWKSNNNSPVTNYTYDADSSQNCTW